MSCVSDRVVECSASSVLLRTGGQLVFFRNETSFSRGLITRINRNLDKQMLSTISKLLRKQVIPLSECIIRSCCDENI